MKNTFGWTLKDGRNARIEASYESRMETEMLDADGWKIPGEKRIVQTGDMKAYVEGKQVDSCWNPEAWTLIDSGTQGVKKIRGMGIGLSGADVERYNEFINSLIAGGTSDDVKAYKSEQDESSRLADIEYAKKIIAKAEKQKDIPTRAEARRREKLYNDICNEGGDGFVPRWTTREEYDYAKQIIAGKN